MAKQHVTARMGEFNPIDLPKICVAFAAFIATLPGLISSEQELGDYCAQDPAVEKWITDAEEARARTFAALDALHKVAGETKIAWLADAFQIAMTSADPEIVKHLHQLASANRKYFLYASGDQMSVFNFLLDISLDHLNHYLDIDFDLEDVAHRDAAVALDAGPEFSAAA